MPSKESQSFAASYDLKTKILSVILCAILVFVAIVTASIVAAGLALVLIVLSYAYSPRGYAIQERSIVVKRLIGNARISLDGVRELRVADADDFRGCIRLFGDGGLFGYYGLFRTSKLGKCWWYVTNRSNAVVVITGAKTAVISPDDAEGFIVAVRPALALSGPPRSA